MLHKSLRGVTAIRLHLAGLRFKPQNVPAKHRTRRRA
jgi:hypothetical protein